MEAIINLIQKQPYRITNCRCIIENNFDLFLVIVWSGLAIIGMLAIIDEYRKLKRISKKMKKK